MNDERILTGYCKAIDGSRTVIVEEGEADCFYPDCPHAPDCPIAKQWIMDNGQSNPNFPAASRR